MSAERVVLVPGVLALLPEYAGLTDPVAELRAACRAAVGWLAEAGPVTVLGDPQGARVGESLVTEVAPGSGVSRLAALAPRPPQAGGVLVVGNGSACRSEKAPGFLNERSFNFDDTLLAALTGVDPAALSGVDPATSHELLAATEGIRVLGDLLTPQHQAQVDYADDPFGVQYWVIRWQLPQPGRD